MKELNQRELVTIALFLLGGDKNPVDTEDIAVKVAGMAPGKFSWRKYKENIDKELVRLAVTNARIESGHVLGSQRDGWMLTPAGLAFSKANVSKSWAKPSERKPEKERLQFQREKIRLLASEAYQLYSSHNQENLQKISKTMADDFFRLNDYVKGQPRINKIIRIQNQFLEDPDLSPLIKLLAPMAKEPS